MPEVAVRVGHRATERCVATISDADVAEQLRGLTEADDLASLARIAVRAMGHLTGAIRIALFLADENGDELSLAADCGWDSASCPCRGIRVDAPLKRLLRTRQTIQPVGCRAMAWPLLLDAGAETRRPDAISPLARDDMVIGAFFLWFPHRLPEDLAQHPALAQFLSQAAVLIDKARAFDTLQRRIDDLSAVVALNEALTRTPSFEALLGHIIEQVKQLTDAEMAGLMLYDPATGELALQKPGFGASEEIIRQYRLPLSGGGNSVHVFRTGVPRLSNDLVKDPIVLQRFVQMNSGRNSISIPLRVDNRPIGVLHVLNKREGDFTDNDMRLVSLLGSHISVLIENAQLLEEQRYAVAKLQELNEVIDHQRAGLERTLAIHDELTGMVLDGQGIAAIVSSLSKLLANPVAVEDRFWNLLSYYPSDDGYGVDAGRRLTIENGGTPEAVRNDPVVRATLTRLGQRRRPVRLEALPEIGFDAPRVVAPIVVGRETMGYLYVVESNRPLDGLDFIAVERAAMALALQMMKEKAAAEAQYKLRGDLVAELLGGGYGPDEVLLGRAAYLDVDLRGARTVLVVDVDDFARFASSTEGEEHVLAIKSKLLAVLDRACKRLSDSLVLAKSDEIIVLAMVQVVPGADYRSAVNGLANALRVEVTRWLPEITVSVGIGSVCNSLADYKQSYQHARSALEVVKALHQRDRILAFDDLGIYGVLVDPHNRPKLLSFVENTIGALLRYDRARGTRLTETLHQYLQQDCHLEQTALALSVHINTLRYRLRRIEEITKTELHGFKARYALHLAVEALNILHLS